jgi:hypothetical protein
MPNTVKLASVFLGNSRKTGLGIRIVLATTIALGDCSGGPERNFLSPAC